MRHPRNEAGPHHGPVEVQPIPAGQMWPLECLNTKCGYGSDARAKAIRLGLPVYRWARRSWIYTDDLIAFLKREGKDDQDQDGRTQDQQSGGEP